MRGNSTGRYTFLMLAGVYLLYLSWQLFSGFRSGDATNPVFILAAVLFAVIGVIIIVTNIRAIMRNSNETASTEETEPSADTSDASVSESNDSLNDSTSSEDNADDGNTVSSKETEVHTPSESSVSDTSDNR